MRRPVDAERIRNLMRALGSEARAEARVYLTGGATAVLLGWRDATIDVDLKFEPESDRLLRAIVELKERLELNVELAAPDQFIPELSGWRDRSLFVVREGHLSFHHYDLYAQALAKIERGHVQDREDVRSMIQRGLVDPTALLGRFEAIEAELFRFPAIDATAFRRQVERAISEPS